MSRKQKSFLAIAWLFTAILLWAAVLHQTKRVQAQVVTFDTGQISCASTVTAVVAQNSRRVGLLITNTGSTVAVYIGGTAVTTGTGAYLPGGGSVSIPTRDAVSCISSGATQTVTFLETF